mgnify:CR=1 FL=1
MKSYGGRRVVDGLSFEAKPGRVTGFLGPNGSGKTTSMRTLLGLADADSGTATFDGKAYASLPDPIHHVGAAIALDTFHPGRSAREHLRVMATAARIEHQRVEVVLEMVGLSDSAKRRVGVAGCMAAILHNAATDAVRQCRCYRIHSWPRPSGGRRAPIWRRTFNFHPGVLHCPFKPG